MIPICLEEWSKRIVGRCAESWVTMKPWSERDVSRRNLDYAQPRNFEATWSVERTAIKLMVPLATDRFTVISNRCMLLVRHIRKQHWTVIRGHTALPSSTSRWLIPVSPSVAHDEAANSGTRPGVPGGEYSLSASVACSVSCCAPKSYHLAWTSFPYIIHSLM